MKLIKYYKFCYEQIKCFFFLYYHLLLFIIKEIKEQILNRCKCLSYLQCHVYIDTRSKLDSDNVLRRGVSLSSTLQVFSFPAIMNNPIIMTYKNQHLGLNGSDDSEEERSMHAAFIFEDRQHCNHLDSLSYKNDIF